jgi:hypothetical protein
LERYFGSSFWWYHFFCNYVIPGENFLLVGCCFKFVCSRTSLLSQPWDL